MLVCSVGWLVGRAPLCVVRVFISRVSSHPTSSHLVSHFMSHLKSSWWQVDGMSGYGFTVGVLVGLLVAGCSLFAVLSCFAPFFIRQRLEI
jgi:uncharacterized membrane protein